MFSFTLEFETKFVLISFIPDFFIMITHQLRYIQYFLINS